MTISRSPILNNDLLNFFQYRLSIGDERIKLSESNKIVNQSNQTLVENETHYWNGNFKQATVSVLGQNFFIDDLGPVYRWATEEELLLAREAATPGTINSWESTNQVEPRNLPARVNEYGFDTEGYNGTALWIVKDSN